MCARVPVSACALVCACVYRVSGHVCTGVCRCGRVNGGERQCLSLAPDAHCGFHTHFTLPAGALPRAPQSSGHQPVWGPGSATVGRRAAAPAPKPPPFTAPPIAATWHCCPRWGPWPQELPTRLNQLSPPHPASCPPCILDWSLPSPRPPAPTPSPGVLTSPPSSPPAPPPLPGVLASSLPPSF